LQEYVNRIGQKLASHRAGPDSEAMLAGVPGHDIGQVTARHTARQQAGQPASNLLDLLKTVTLGNG